MVSDSSKVLNDNSAARSASPSGMSGSTRLVETLDTKGNVMEPNQQTDTDTELVTESLVEEVSIDGMCGVY
jgi:mycofactocin precursor peptide MftA